MEEHKFKSKEVPLTKDMIESLVALKNKACIGYEDLYRYGKAHTEHEVFKATSYTLPQQWASGNVKTVDMEFYKTIVETFESIPALSRRVEKIQNEPITEEFYTALKGFIDQPRQLSINKIFTLSETPAGLTPRTISRILKRHQKSIQPDHLKFLLKLIAKH